MAEKPKARYMDFGISSMEMLPAYITGTEEDVVDALAISRQYADEAKLDDNDSVEDSLRHILFGGLLYGNPEEEGFVGKAQRGLAGYLADAKERKDPESFVDLNNNEFGRKLRQQYPDREEFIAKAKEIANALAKGEETPEIDGVTVQKSYGTMTQEQIDALSEQVNSTQKEEMATGGLMLAPGGAVARATKSIVAPTAVAMGTVSSSEEAEAAYIPLRAFREGTEQAKKFYDDVIKLIDEGVDDSPNGELYQRTGAYRSEDGSLKVDVAELRARDLEMAQAVGEFAEDADFFIKNPKKTTKDITTPISKYLPSNSPIFENFPELKDAKVILRRGLKEEEGTYGYYSPNKKEIHVLFSTKGDDRKTNITDPVRAFNTLIHEFQHYIQDVKGAANTGFNTTRTGFFKDKIKTEVPQLRARIAEFPDDEVAKAKLKQYEDLFEQANVDLDKYLSGKYGEKDPLMNKLRQAVAEESLSFGIYVRELGEAEARSTGRKAFLTADDPARKELGVFYPATPEDPGTLEAVKIGSEKALPSNQILVRSYPNERYKEAYLEFVDPKTGQRGDKKLSVAGAGAATATGLASMPSEALADALGLSRERTGVAEQIDITDQDSAMAYIESRMGANPETVGTAPSDIIEDAPIVGDVVAAADLTYMAGEANKMKPGEEQPEAVDEFSDIPRDISGMATGGLMFNEYNQLNPIPQQMGVAMRQGGGIQTEAGKDMAQNKFQLDREKADLNKDGKLSDYEKARGEAVQKEMGEGKETKMAMGGMMADPFAPFQVHMGMDTHSGNDIPAGSKPEEVRDDIPAMLSEGEYVVPADVVRWHGLKTFEMLRCEAKNALGLMAMHDRISFVDDETREPVEYEEEEYEEDDEIEEDDKPEVEEAEVKVVEAQEGTSVEPLPTQPTYITRPQINPTTGRYEFVYIDPTTGQQVSQEEFDASRATRYAPEDVVGREVYGRGQEPECPEGYIYDADIGACVPEDGVEEEPVSVTTPTVTGGSGDGGDGSEDVGGRTDYASQGLTKFAEQLGPLSAEDLADYEGATLADKAVSRMMTPGTPVSLQGGIMGLALTAGQNLYDDVGARRAAITREQEFTKDPTAQQAYNFTFDPVNAQFVATTPSTRITEKQERDGGGDWATDYNHVGASGNEYTSDDVFSNDDAFEDVMSQIDRDFENMTAVTGSNTSSSSGDGGDDGGVTAAESQAAADNYGTTAGSQQSDMLAEQDRDFNDDSGSDNGDSKIVCTAMNSAYGFGSFRQAIWLKHSADMSPEYEAGYHALFQPLVDYAYKTEKFGHKTLRKALEHIARRRTADIWKQKHGKRDLIGAVERAVLEPLCYIAGYIKLRNRV